MLEGAMAYSARLPQNIKMQLFSFYLMLHSALNSLQKMQ